MGIHVAKNIDALKYSISLSAGLAMMLSSEAFAQESDEIIVTARKKDESILEVPIAITAFDEKRIEDLNLTDINSLPEFTPGFSYPAFVGFPGRVDNGPRFRGLGINSTNATRQAASVFVDGIFVAGGAQGIQLDNVERVEIIKGPQSAYFGRNTFGGAVNYITKRPGDELGGTVTAEAQTRGEYALSGLVSGPLAGDSVKFSLNGAWRDKEGHFDNPGVGDRLGDENTWSIGGGLFFNPSDNFDAFIRGTYFENEDGAAPVSLSGLADHNCGPFAPATDTTVCGDAPVNTPALDTDLPTGLQNFLENNNLFLLNGPLRDELGLDREAVRLTGGFNLDFDNGIVLSSLSGYNYEELNLLRDADSSTDPQFWSFLGRQFEDISQEVRLRGNAFDEKLDWSAGVNYFYQEFTSNGDFLLGSGRAFGDGDFDVEQISTIGFFGSVDYAFNDQLSASFEGRYQIDEISNDGDLQDTSSLVQTTTFKNFLPRLTIDYQLNNDTLLYAQFARGNLPGGHNPAVAVLSAASLAELRAIEPTADVAFDEEELDNYEIGIKSRLGDNKGAFQLAMFYMDRKNQGFRRSDFITRPGGGRPLQVNHNVNAGQSELLGFEFEGNYNLTDMFSVESTIGYLDGEFKTFESGNFLEVFGSTDASGQTVPRFPKWSGSLSGVANGDLSNGMGWFARADALYTGERFADETNLTTARDGVQVNLRAGVTNDDYRFELFVTNLTDAEHPTAINRFRDLSAATPFFDFSTLGFEQGLRDKRQFGARIRYNF